MYVNRTLVYKNCTSIIWFTISYRMELNHCFWMWFKQVVGSFGGWMMDRRTYHPIEGNKWL